MRSLSWHIKQVDYAKQTYKIHNIYMGNRKSLYRQLTKYSSIGITIAYICWLVAFLFLILSSIYGIIFGLTSMILWIGMGTTVFTFSYGLQFHASGIHYSDFTTIIEMIRAGKLDIDVIDQNISTITESSWSKYRARIFSSHHKEEGDHWRYLLIVFFPTIILAVIVHIYAILNTTKTDSFIQIDITNESAFLALSTLFIFFIRWILFRKLRSAKEHRFKHKLDYQKHI